MDMVIKKRKRFEVDMGHETRRMRLRKTQERDKYGAKLQRTPKRPNAFFDHLPLDVRHLIYDLIPLRPFREAKNYSGLYLSCRQAKKEMDNAAAPRLRTYLLEIQQKHSNDHVEISLPRELTTAAIPVDTMIDINIKIRLSTPSIRPNKIVIDIALSLHMVKLNKVHIHMVETPWNNPLWAPYKPKETLVGSIIERLLGPNALWVRLIGRSFPIRVKELIVSRERKCGGKEEPIQWMDGLKYEITAQSGFRVPYGYKFKQEDGNATAWVVVAPRPYLPGDPVEMMNWDLFWLDYLDDRKFVDRLSKATMDFTTLEIGDGEEIPKRT
ncbi:uncharacterized protein K460DRAFT_414546 [Cucurbitaria berberidis CBS 394.84]|uniref:Uncharacterized protein n=1 Tax=Cucurbitaria berberidis CBS 394.84 TaxID=1168544 RepID=A0A9P4LB06_9PLEO|nr:uncharacterized protein K460DRAFT_414546 [Cucurbitaria berberidis CBS 394.84]KAF1847897.1 hypothetical protein K460DRAFT_414546 [Cucurbitaria berberidis CBS 394.84]